jgi:hypothetical protein
MSEKERIKEIEGLVYWIERKKLNKETQFSIQRKQLNFFNSIQWNRKK